MKRIFLNGLGPYINELSLLIITGTLFTAFYYQLVLNEIPCPLCLLQRASIVLIGAGFLFNIQFGTSTRHFGMALVGCVVTAAVATRQVFLHILPQATGYGGRLLGLHLYTWTLVFAVAMMLCIAFALMQPEARPASSGRVPTLARRIVVLLFVSVVVMNLASVFLECGLSQCVDNPVGYKWLDAW
ncbi:disulfide bond formation protein B [Robbsia sp. Bb-Pol-6]|uniref:Disulfide bond formation protein B n=1 Tax=Robbsia betulipollinis TaxID=2981849 RepID=A0ABT3ZL19_9BURK|nr:disulfide bond formation protein B [Robbsia betulipollinis]MCY0387234.1 disulfide bond formation protein B [Robbsia betulipollinis]